MLSNEARERLERVRDSGFAPCLDDIADALAELERLRFLEGAAAADGDRLVAAAEKAGIVFVGCDTPDALADEVLALLQQVHQLRAALSNALAATEGAKPC